MYPRLRVGALVLLLGVLGSSAAWAQEGISLTVPITTPNILLYTPARLELQLLPAPRITVTIAHVGTNRTETFYYPCASPCTTTTEAQVTTLITNLNTANLTTRTLWRRIFDKLVVDFPSRFPGGATVQ